MRIDEFFYKQPNIKFVDQLSQPIHKSAPKHFGRRVVEEGEVFAGGAYIGECHSEWCDAIATAIDDYETFLRVSGVYGHRYPIRILYAEGYSEESYKIAVDESQCIIYATDPNGARRAVYYLEEEMIKREGAFLPFGETVRTAYIKRHITRGYFSPTNRVPKWGDELLDDVDYYPENYLSRLAHNGTNGLWIYTSFAQLIKSPYLPSKDEHCSRRMEKLRGIVKKCKKYGIKVYLFAIEPLGLLAEDHATYEDMLGAFTKGERRPFCPRIDKVREHVIYCLENIFRAIPDLGGYITIPAGERPTTCASVGTYNTCPRCSRYSKGENLAYSIDLIKEGLRRAGTGAEFISWTYGHRYWDDEDIMEYIEHAPDDVVLMQNFEDRGVDVQLGKKRIAWDYWLSYPGPSDMFAMSARTATANNKRMYAKMQVCSSHEIATVPYIPVPGILYDKYIAARDLGVTGIMECWYFGNYPSLMNRASTELSYMDAKLDKNTFLHELAARIYGRSMAEGIVRAWRAFEEGYRNYPTNIMMSYYGPMHDGVTWELFPIPVNRALPRSWQLLDPPDGDRIGECLFKGHTLDEAILLSERMNEAFARGCALLPLDKDDEQSLCASAIELLTRSANNILRFYKLREQLGTGACDPWETVTKMEMIVSEEIENSERMIEICNADPRIGYHSEAEGFKFFKEKLEARIKKLDELFLKDFDEIRGRLLNGEHPLDYYYAEGMMDAYPLGYSDESFKWEDIDADRAFGAYIDGDQIKLPIKCPEDDSFTVCFEFTLFHPESTVIYSPKACHDEHAEVSQIHSPGLHLGECVLSHQGLWGDGVKEELSKYHVESCFENGVAYHILSVKIPEGKWNGKSALRLKVVIGTHSWKSDPDPVITLGKHDISPNDFGFLLPISK